MSGFFQSMRLEAAAATTSIFASAVTEFMLAGNTASSGARVTFDSAMSLSAVSRCVHLIAEGLAKKPRKIYRRLPNGGKEEARDHPLWNLLHNQPNRLQTSFEWTETKSTHVLLTGNSYSFKVFVRGVLTELIPIHPDSVEVNLTKTRDVIYTVTNDNGAKKDFSRARIFHLKALSSNGYSGRSVLQEARDSFGFSIATEEHGAHTFRNSAQIKGIFETDHALTPEGRDNFLNSWKENHTGFVNAGKTPLLEDGIKFNPVSMSAKDSQFIEQRKFQVSDVARRFGVPLHKLGVFDSQPRANMEQQAVEFNEDTLLAWAVRDEQAMNSQLLENDPEFFVEYLFDASARAELVSRYQAYQIGIQNGILTLDQVLQKENMNPIGGPIGQQRLMPLNHGVRGQIDNANTQRTNGVVGNSAGGAGDAQPLVV